MRLNEQELVFKVHWVEKLKILCRIVYIPVLIICKWKFSLDFSINDIFFKCFLIVLLSIIAFIILSIYIFNKKIVISNGILTYYREKEVWSRKIEKDKIRVFNGSSWFYENIKYLWIDYCNIPISLFGKKNCLKIRKIVYDARYERTEIEDRTFEISKKELFTKKWKNIFRIYIVGIIIVLGASKIIFSKNAFMITLLVIIYLLCFISDVAIFIREKKSVPTIMRVSNYFFYIDNEKYSKNNIKKLEITDKNLSKKAVFIRYYVLKIFRKNEEK